ncbi:unnamed protein product [Ectocarpus sp. CCAP 1310/34]|nr:unnamed protein product [Ectocarpus sp. CCAP 1310/34]
MAFRTPPLLPASYLSFFRSTFGALESCGGGRTLFCMH